MKSPLLPLTLAAFVAMAAAASSRAADKPADSTKILMQEKLREAQAILGALAIEDFSAIGKSADRLIELSNHTNWYSRQTPEYDLFLNGFRRNAQVLAKAARERNIDGASLAYTQLTLTCFSCHKYMRVPPTAAIPSLSPKLAQAPHP